jgi:hypothetical protein
MASCCRFRRDASAQVIAEGPFEAHHESRRVGGTEVVSREPSRVREVCRKVEREIDVGNDKATSPMMVRVGTGLVAHDSLHGVVEKVCAEKWSRRLPAVA